MKVKISEIKANPFKRFINEGELDSERVDKLVESIEHGTLPAQFVARKNEAGEWEQTSGHHRLAAFKKKYGKDFEVDITLVKFSDELMLIDMVRENITQRDTDFHDTEASIILARTWLQSGANTIKQLYGVMNKENKSGLHPKGKFGGSLPQPDSYMSIAKFLSKNGNAVSHMTVKTYCDIHDKLDKELYKRIGKEKLTTKLENREGLSLRVAEKLSTLDKPEQKLVLDKIDHLAGKAATKVITSYKAADDKSKKLFVEGKITADELETLTKEEAQTIDEWETHGKKEYKLTQAQANINLNELHSAINKTKEALAKTEMAIELKLLKQPQLTSARNALKELANDIYQVDRKIQGVIE